MLYYRISRGMPAEMPVAVVVQRMIASKKSGVMFTADPATGESDHVVIEAAWGLGEVVVGGQVTPDHYVVEVDGGEARDATLQPEARDAVEEGDAGEEESRDEETGAKARAH